MLALPHRHVLEIGYGVGLREAWIGHMDRRPHDAGTHHPDAAYHAAPLATVTLRMLVLDLFDRLDAQDAVPPGLGSLPTG